MKKITSRSLLWGILGTAALFAAPVMADQLADMAARLAKLRGEVESLSSDLSMVTADGRDQLRSLSRQKADLELEIKKEQTRVAKLSRAIEEKKEAVEEAQSEDRQMAPLFESQIENVRAYVTQGLPFRTSDRLSELEKLESQYKSGLLSAPKAVSRLWAFIEDEFRLTRENGLYQQTITVNGEPQLADVVRVGMVMMYFKVGESTLGKAVKKDGEWSFVVLDSDEDQKQVLELFHSFKKQIRQGFFTVPNALPPIEETAQ